MLGRTHVVNSLALLHVGLVGYTAYVSHRHKTDSLEILGFEFGEPLALTSYALIVTTVTLFVMLLLRIGKRQFRLGYLVGMIIGLFALGVLFDTTYSLEITWAILAFTLGSLLPDIDSEESTIGRYVAPLARAIPHRTITHTLWMILLFALPAWYFGSIYLWALALGVTVHIVQDTFSRQGIAWFYPIVGGYDQFENGGAMKKGRNTTFSYRVGGRGEEIVYYASVFTHIVCVGFVTWTLLA